MITGNEPIFRQTTYEMEEFEDRIERRQYDTGGLTIRQKLSASFMDAYISAWSSGMPHVSDLVALAMTAADVLIAEWNKSDADAAV